ncbi:MAG: TrkH family potassium uptake protein [Flavobacteriales bacterium]|nr:TrkH family potassium uptake protein [Flavobacteriales bacterium]
MTINYRVVFNVLGLLLIFNGLFMFLCLPASFYFNMDDIVPMGFSATLTVGFGLLTWVLTRAEKKPNIRKREGFLIVTFGWVVMALSGTLPYIMSGSVISFTDAFFETLSGYTTTGASIINDLSVIPKDILFWRSMTQWIGGMGIIVLAVAILPVLGIGGMQLFVAESPGLKPDKLAPKIRDTAKRLWLIYVGLTATEFLLLKIAGMTWFDALNHALTTMATGGFSTHNSSAAEFSPAIQYIITGFMFLAGTSFTLIYFGLTGSFKKVLKNEEFKFYTGIILFVTLGVSLVVASVDDGSFEQSFRHSLFQVISIITSTGFVSADYTGWTSFLTMIFFILLFFGGSAGSTAGGVKIVRHIILVKNSILELKRQVHPSAVIPVRLNGRAIDQSITYNVVAFIMMYIIIFAFGSVVMTMFGVDFDTALGSVATSLGNIGPGIGDVGPMNNFSWLPSPAKWFLAILMLVGRLELFTVLILITPYFWRKQG